MLSFTVQPSEREVVCSELAMKTKSVYIRPYPDTIFGSPIVFRGVWILWLLHLILKILCEDSDWGLFLITTGLLTLYSVQFFIVSFLAFSCFLKFPLMQTKEVLVEEIKPVAASTPSPKKVKKEKTPVESSTTTSESSLDVPEIKKPPTYALIVKEEKVSTPSDCSLEIPKRTAPKYSVCSLV